MNPLYVIARTDQPHLMLFTSLSLAEIATAVRAQPDQTGLEVYASIDGLWRPLTQREQDELAEHLG